MKTLFVALIFALSAVFAADVSAEVSAAEVPAEAPMSLDQFEKNVYAAVALFYAQTEDGTFKQLCTATAFERSGKTYKFITAAHCVAEDNVLRERVEVVRVRFLTTFDEEGEKGIVPVKLLAVGYQCNGDDLAVFEVQLKKEIPVIPLAAKNAIRGEHIVNVASPLGLGKQLFRGYVSSSKLDRPMISERAGINWDGATLLDISVGPGSSGSAVVSPKQGGIVGILVGTIGGRSSTFNVVAIPVEQFHKFWNAAKAGKYKWYRPEEIGVNVSHDPTAVKRLIERSQKGIVFRPDHDEDL